MIIDGKKIAGDILARIQAEIKLLPFQPEFCDVLVGDDPVSASYVRIKEKTAEQLGVNFLIGHFPEDISQADLLLEIAELNKRQNICGIIVQLPLPPVFDRQQVLDAIDPRLDVDGVGSINTKLFYEGGKAYTPPAAAAIVEILEQISLNFTTSKFLVIGKGILVGRPVAHLLAGRGYSVESADRSSQDLFEKIKSADVVISAAGQAGLVRGEFLKPGSIVIDAGTSESEGGIVGDADFASVSRSASFLSPVPGGVGPVTVAKLFSNLLLAARTKIK